MVDHIVLTLQVYDKGVGREPSDEETEEDIEVTDETAGGAEILKR